MWLVQIGKIDLDKLKPNLPKKENGNKEESTKSQENLTLQKEISKETQKVSNESSIKTQYKKLTGLKTVGDKIDLNKFEKP